MLNEIPPYLLFLAIFIKNLSRIFQWQYCMLTLADCVTNFVLRLHNVLVVFLSTRRRSTFKIRNCLARLVNLWTSEHFSPRVFLNFLYNFHKNMAPFAVLVWFRFCNACFALQVWIWAANGTNNNDVCKWFCSRTVLIKLQVSWRLECCRYQWEFIIFSYLPFLFFNSLILQLSCWQDWLFSLAHIEPSNPGNTNRFMWVDYE